jgi:O-antigen ligase
MPSRQRHALIMLFAIYLALLSGRTTFSALGLPSEMEVRIAILPGLLIAWFLWMSQAVHHGDGRGHRVVTVPLALFATYMGLTSTWAPEGARVDEALVDLVLLVVLIALASSVARRLSPSAISGVWIWFTVTGGIYLVAALVQGPGPQGRFAALGGGPNVFVRVMVIAAVSSIALSLLRKDWRWATLAPAFIAGSFLSGSRGGLAAVAIVGVVLGKPVITRLPRVVVTRMLVGTALIAIIVLTLAPEQVRTDLQERFVTQTLQDRHTSSRTTTADGALDVFRSHPVTGAGIDGYYALIGEQSGLQHPHNLVLATLAEGGLIGGLLLGAALLAPALRLVRLPTTTGSLWFGVLAAYIFAASLFSGDYYDARFIWFFAVFALSAANAERPHGGEGITASDLPRSPRPHR